MQMRALCSGDGRSWGRQGWVWQGWRYRRPECCTAHYINMLSQNFVYLFLFGKNSSIYVVELSLIILLASATPRNSSTTTTLFSFFL